MAKESKAVDCEDLARELFIARWAPKSPIMTDEFLAAHCVAAASVFQKVISQIREGRTAAQIIGEEEPLVTPGDRTSVAA